MNDNRQLKHASNQIVDGNGNHVEIVRLMQRLAIPKYVQQNGVQVKADYEQDEKIEWDHIEEFTVDGRRFLIIKRFVQIHNNVNSFAHFMRLLCSKEIFVCLKWNRKQKQQP